MLSLGSDPHRVKFDASTVATFVRHDKTCFFITVFHIILCISSPHGLPPLGPSGAWQHYGGGPSLGCVELSFPRRLFMCLHQKSIKNTDADSVSLSATNLDSKTTTALLRGWWDTVVMQSVGDPTSYLWKSCKILQDIYDTLYKTLRRVLQEDLDSISFRFPVENTGDSIVLYRFVTAGGKGKRCALCTGTWWRAGCLKVAPTRRLATVWTAGYGRGI